MMLPSRLFTGNGHKPSPILLSWPFLTFSSSSSIKVTLFAVLFYLSHLTITSHGLETLNVEDEGGGSGSDSDSSISNRDGSFSSIVGRYNINPSLQIHIYIPSYDYLNHHHNDSSSRPLSSSSSPSSSSLSSSPSEQIIHPKPIVYHLVINLDRRKLENRFLTLLGPIDYHISDSICIQVGRSLPAESSLCDELNEPRRPSIEDCNDIQCPPSWAIENWSKCSVNCGGGYQYRSVYCIQKATNDTIVRLPVTLCPLPLPESERSCNTHQCPQWFEEPWSKCSVTCGTGHQTRKVTCRDGLGRLNSGCNNSTKPISKRSCALPPCLKESGMDMDRGLNDNEYILADGKDFGTGGEGNSDDRFNEDELPLASPSFTIPWAKHSSQPKFSIGDWSECSSTCGSGIRKRKIHCKILMDFSKITSIVPDSECIGEKPHEYEECNLPPCPDLDEVKYSPVAESSALALTSDTEPVTYSWKTSGFTKCSASCLGGTQESVIQCVRDYDQMVVNHFLCNIEDKPDSLTKTCNDHPCPPRWNISDFGPCSVSCGGGIQRREINCIHEVTRGSENTLVVPGDRCTDPRPIEQRVCNEFDCPVSVAPDQTSISSSSEKWPKCKGKDCKYGSSSSKPKPKCSKDANSLTRTSSGLAKCTKNKSSNCVRKPCKQRQATRFQDDGSMISADASSTDRFVQPSSVQKKVTLRIGGTAVIYKGTTLKIRCPRRRGANGLLPRVEWLKDGKKIAVDRKVTMSRRGALKIRNVTVKDAGTYTCSFGSNRLSMSVEVKRLPISAIRVTSDETNRYDSEESTGSGSNRNPTNTQEVSLENDLDKSQVTSKNKEPSSFETNRLDESVVVDDLGQLHDKWRFRSTDEARLTYIADQQTQGSENDQDKGLQSSIVSMPPTSSSLNSDWNDAVRLSGPDVLSSFIKLSSRSQRKNSGEPQDEVYGEAKLSPTGESLTNVKFEWMVSQWSPCSQACGGSGFQVRARQCLFRFNNDSKPTGENHCSRNGLKPPSIFQNCGLSECPTWKTGQWKKCSKCVDFGQGRQSRDVICILSNGTQMSESDCGFQIKPETDQPCSNEDCRPMWSMSDWSMCSGVCDKEGSQVRSVKCVWLADQSSIAEGCDESKKPQMKRKCHVNCDDKQSNCLDASFLCRYAKELNSCNHHVFRSACCKTCRSLELSPQ